MGLLQKIFKEDTINSTNINKQVIFYLLFILIAVLKQLYGVEQHLDIPFFDETEYLQKGIGLGKHAFNDWGPSYNLWYFVLSRIIHDPVQVFYLNYSLMMLLIPALFFLFLISYGIEKNISLLLSLSFVMQPLLVSNFTFVSHFCLLNILLAFIAMSYSKRNDTKVLMVMIASYICMYARQEFLLIFMSISFLWLTVLIFQKKIRFTPVYFLLFGLVAGFYMIFGFISFRAQGIDRSLFAFKQHFYTNYIFWTKNILTVDQFDQLDIFQGSKTMFQCILANPAMFAKHIGTNILNYGINFYKYTENLILPQPVFHYLGKGKHILFIVFILYLIFLIIKKKEYRNIVQFIEQNTFTSILMGLFFGWSFFSIFFIFPERHYIILQIIWWIFLLALMLKNNLKWINKAFIFYPLVFAALLFTPTAESISYYHNQVVDAEKQPNLKVINYLKTNNTGSSEVIFTTERGFNAYLPENYHELFLEQDDVRPYIRNGSIDIQQFFIDKKVRVIYMNEKMQKLIRQSLGETGEVLLNEPEKMGFKKEIIDKALVAYLLVKI